MDGFMDFVVGAVVASVAAFLLFKRFFLSIGRDFEVYKLEKNEDLATRGFLYLEILCRELANHMMTRDSDFYLKTYQTWQEERDRIGTFSESEMQDRLRAITSEIPLYDDFDIVGVRDFISVDRILHQKDIEDIAEHYRRIKAWIALLSRTNQEWRSATGLRFGDEKQNKGIDEYQLLENEIRRIKHTALKAEIDKAMDAYWLNLGDEMNWDNADYEVSPLPINGPSDEYGVHLKRLNKYAIVEIFTFDDNRQSIHCFECDELFSESSRKLVYPY